MDITCAQCGRTGEPRQTSRGEWRCVYCYAITPAPVETGPIGPVPAPVAPEPDAPLAAPPKKHKKGKAK